MVSKPGQQPVVLPLFEREESGWRAQRAGLIRDSMGYFLSKLVPGLFGFVLVPVLIRLVGVDQYGRLAVILPLLMVFGGAGSGWLAQGLLRFQPTADDGRTRLIEFDGAISLGTGLSLISTCALLGVVLFALGYGTLTVSIGVGLCFFFLAYSVTLTKLQAELRPM